MRERFEPASPGHDTNPLEVPGLAELRAEVAGDPEVCIAVLDGAVDRSHPCFAGALLEEVAVGACPPGGGSEHGTHVASVLFGQPGSAVEGIAPRCRGLLLPIFPQSESGSLLPCSQLDLARAITEARVRGARVINISGGELAPAPETDPFLLDAVRGCFEENVLIVAAAGNEGADRLHVPAALPSVLAVGAMSTMSTTSTTARPLPCSNWGGQGVLAPGEEILGALPGGGTAARTGTSFATPIVAGVAALLLSLQKRSGREPDPQAVREAILDGADACDSRTSTDCERFLAGTLNVSQARRRLANHFEPTHCLQTREDNVIERDGETASEDTGFRDMAAAAESPRVPTGRVAPAGGCGCGGKEGEKPCQCQQQQQQEIAFVYALGSLTYDFGTDARRDSLFLGMTGSPYDPEALLSRFDQAPWEAASLHWVLTLDSTPIYAIRPTGPFAEVGFQRLREFLRAQVQGAAERVSVPGVLAGQVILLSGQTVPVILPEIRGLYSWSTAQLAALAAGSASDEKGKAAKGQQKELVLRDFLSRVYYEFRNLGRAPEDRALNYAVTNAFQVAQVFEKAIRDQVELDKIEVQKSAVCRPGSDCWDVKMTFFDPRHRLDQARTVFRFTVDVSDVIPVLVGEVRSWSVY